MTRLEQRRPAVFALTIGGARLAERIARLLPGELHLPAEKADHAAVPGSGASGPEAAAVPVQRFDSVGPAVREAFEAGSPLVCVMAAGVVVRSLAPVLAGKRSDPAVVVLDEAGRFAVPLLGGHLGGANALAQRLAGAIGAEPVLTTSSDVQGLLGPDLLAERLEATVLEPEALTEAAAALVNGRPVFVEYDPAETGPEAERVRGLAGYALRAVGTVDAGGDVAPGIEPAPAGDANAVGPAAASGSDAGVAGSSADPVLIRLTLRPLPADGSPPGASSARLTFVPRRVRAGVGCRRGTASSAIVDRVRGAFRAAGLHPAALGGLASVQAKADEEGLLQAAEELGVPAAFASPEELGEIVRREGLAEGAFVRQQVGVGAVAEPAALWAAGPNARLVLGKQAGEGVTVALALGAGVPA